MTNSGDTPKQTKPDQSNHTHRRQISQLALVAMIQRRPLWCPISVGCDVCLAALTAMVMILLCCRGNNMSHTVLGNGSVIRVPDCGLVCSDRISMSAL